MERSLARFLACIAASCLVAQAGCGQNTDEIVTPLAGAGSNLAHVDGGLVPYKGNKAASKEAASPTRFGIMYSLWHCPYSESGGQPISDISEILQGNQKWGLIPKFHWWDKPVLGYYCLQDHKDVLQAHAVMLRDAGIDFVFLDVSNHAYTTDPSSLPYWMILNPFDALLEVWNKIPNAPRVVPWLPIPKNLPTLMVEAMLQRLTAYPEMHFRYNGKPLILVVKNAHFPIDNDKINELKGRGYEIRIMWAFQQQGTEIWSQMEECQSGFKQSGGKIACLQRSAVRNGQVEQVSISVAYQETQMSRTSTAVPKFLGRTFRRQFETLFDNPTAPIATIGTFNEWMANRFCYPKAGETSHTWCCSGTGPSYWCKTGPGYDEFYSYEGGNKVFIDQYDIEYSKDIEPGQNEMGDYYMRLVKSCIGLHQQGRRCDATTQGELCCKDYKPLPAPPAGN